MRCGWQLAPWNDRRHAIEQRRYAVKVKDIMTCSAECVFEYQDVVHREEAVLQGLIEKLQRP